MEDEQTNAVEDTAISDETLIAAERDAKLTAPQKNPIGVELRETALVESYRKEFLSNFGVKWITAALESGSVYRAYARKKIAELNMPACLEYLPLIESAYKPDARSRTGALGLWQFMENSIAPFMQKNRYVDERLDPWKATDAALAKLNDNYRQFGDWLLALAAYNAGAGAVSRALAQSKEKTFWALFDAKLIREESRQYVPKFLAICDILINEDYFGVSFPALTDSDELELVAYTAPYSVVISKLRSELEIDAALFSYLNPSLLLDISPKGFTFRLPAYLSEKTAYVFEASRAADTLVHVVVSGETLWGISRRYGVTVEDICVLNRINEKAILPIGKTLLVPILK
jgi:membrane-bound lytic murein transglycosylase D